MSESIKQRKHGGIGENIARLAAKTLIGSAQNGVTRRRINIMVNIGVACVTATGGVNEDMAWREQTAWRGRRGGDVA
jgi:hypothetical protein